jgi:hypothetical protein
MQKKPNTSGPGGPKSDYPSKAASVLSNKRGTTTKPKTVSVSPISQSVITQTSVKRREALKALANR